MVHLRPEENSAKRAEAGNGSERIATLCGIDVDLFRNSATAEEVARIVASQDSEWQGNFLDAIAKNLAALGPHRRDSQVAFIAAAVVQRNDAAVELIHDLEWWVNNERQKQLEDELSIPLTTLALDASENGQTP